MAEYLDIYDDNKNRTGKIVKRESNTKLSENEFVLTVHCWTLNLKNEILMTRRSFEKSHGGMWEPTGGCVKSGENSIQGIKRELEEEIGLIVQSDELKLIKEEKDEIAYRDIYLLKKDFDIKNLKFNDKEVIDAKFVTIDEFKSMIDNDEVCYYHEYFVEIYNNL